MVGTTDKGRVRGRSRLCSGRESAEIEVRAPLDPGGLFLEETRPREVERLFRVHMDPRLRQKLLGAPLPLLLHLRSPPPLQLPNKQLRSFSVQNPLTYSGEFASFPDRAGALGSAPQNV